MFSRFSRAGSTINCASSFEILEQINKFLPVFGITRVSNITGLDRIGIPVASAIRPNSKSMSTSQGKGVSLEQAKISALMETIESFHAENIFLDTTYITTEDMMYKNEIIDLNGLPQKFSNPIKLDKRILWLKGNDLLSNKEIFVPFDSVNLDLSLTGNSSSFISDSNGLASSISHTQAILHGIYEVIERDALFHYFSNEDAFGSKKIDLNSINDKPSQNVIEKIHAASINIGIWNISNHIGIPTYICRLIDSPNFYKIARPTYGSAAHCNKNIALIKSILEAVQSRATFFAGTRDDQSSEKYQDSYQDKITEEWHNKISAPETKKFSECYGFIADNDQDEHDHLIDRLSHYGVKNIVDINLTKEELGIPVHKIIIPYMEGITNTHDRIKVS